MNRLLARSVLACLAGVCWQLAAAAEPANWPQWRGPNHDGISLDKNLLRDWPPEGPPIAWQVDSVGVGYSSLAIKDDCIYTQGDLDGVEHILALSAADGHTLWAVQPKPVVEILEARIGKEFKQLDKDGDGKVDELEALARFGWDWNKFDKPGSEAPAALAERRSAALFGALDKNGDGQLTFDEAGPLLRDTFERVDAPDSKADAAAVAAARTAAYLKDLDKDGDGRISKPEAKGTALDRHFGRIDVRDPATNKADELLTADEIRASLEKHEQQRDGVLTRAELRDYYAQNKIRGDGQLTPAELQLAFGGYRNGMGDGPRGTPTIDGERLFVEGGNGDVSCLLAATGETLWHVNLAASFGGGVPGWGYSESPLVVDNLLIVTPGGKAGTLLALDKLTGKPVWQSKEANEHAHYSSPVLAEIDGIRQIVQFANQSVFAVALDDGRLLWRYTAPANGTANCCSPIVAGHWVFASSAYGTGGGLAKISTAGSSQSAEQVYFEKKMACHHGGLVKVGDFLYSAAAGTLMCMEFQTGNIAWQARGAGKGSLCVADGMLYIVGENHEVALAEVNPQEYREHGRFKIKEHGKPAWAHPVVTGGRFYIRDQESLAAYDVLAK